MKKQNLSGIILLISLGVIMAFFSFSYALINEKSFSEHENRILQQFPAFSISKLINGTYTSQLHNYFSDQIAFRTQLIKLKASSELLMGKIENNGILLGKNGYLIETHQYVNENYDCLRKNLYKIEKIMQNLKDNNVKVNSFIIPRKIDILQDYFPRYYSDKRNKLAWKSVGDKHISLTKSLAKAQNGGAEIFYKTDHHWTAEGAYFAYIELSNIMEFMPLSLDRFQLQTLSNDFYGTTYSKSGFFFTDADKIDAPTIEKGRYRVTIVETNTKFDTLYDSSYLNKKDKYSVFLSGNNAHVKIYDTQNNTKETLLIIKDSFAHSIAPYLCEHYNLELIDPRYYNGSIEQYINENNIKNVLFMFGIDTLALGNIIIK